MLAGFAMTCVDAMPALPVGALGASGCVVAPVAVSLPVTVACGASGRFSPPTVMPPLALALISAFKA